MFKCFLMLSFPGKFGFILIFDPTNTWWNVMIDGWDGACGRTLIPLLHPSIATAQTLVPNDVIGTSGETLSIFIYSLCSTNTEGYIDFVSLLSSSLFLFVDIFSLQVQARVRGHQPEEDSGGRGKVPWAADGRHETKAQPGIWRDQRAAGTG